MDHPSCPKLGHFPQQLPTEKPKIIWATNGQFVRIHRHTHQISKETTPKIFLESKVSKGEKNCP